MKTPAGATLAKRVYALARPGYQAHTVAALDADRQSRRTRDKMTSEWMKVMLDEIERKKAEAEQARLEHERRRAEQAAAPRRGAATTAARAKDDSAQG